MTCVTRGTTTACATRGVTRGTMRGATTAHATGAMHNTGNGGMTNSICDEGYDTQHTQ